MFNDDYRWPEGPFTSDADGASTPNWDDYGPYRRQGYDPSYDSYSYACLVDSVNQGWEDHSFEDHTTTLSLNVKVDDPS
ncbi:hypothetical protein J1N35_018563 [Gossypium stocksii]|uniref:Uncharacterized protein n=1 Tax=Gossypium stocksii TaxID=47602 RepID=A0A9D3VP98_9ROSI|nr:hypothetical protein J1N35_018563 [Gossypium stocksii]